LTGKVGETKTFQRTLEGEKESLEAERLGVRFAAFSPSSLALISECGTERMRRAKFVKASLSSVSFLAEAIGGLDIASTFS